MKREWAHAASIWRGLWWNLTHHAFQEPAVHAGSLQSELNIYHPQPVAL